MEIRLEGLNVSGRCCTHRTRVVVTGGGGDDGPAERPVLPDGFGKGVLSELRHVPVADDVDGDLGSASAGGRGIVRHRQVQLQHTTTCRSTSQPSSVWSATLVEL